MWQFSIFIGRRCKQKTTDIWRCANEDQCVPDKTGCSCRKTTRGVRLARQACWCCACRSSSSVLHESYCRIPSLSSISPDSVRPHPGDSGGRLNIQQDVLSQILVKSRSREICIYNWPISLKFDRHFGSIAADVPVKFQSDTTIQSTNLVASRLHKILWKDVFSDIETGPWSWVPRTILTCTPTVPRSPRITTLSGLVHTQPF